MAINADISSDRKGEVKASSETLRTRSTTGSLSTRSLTRWQPSSVLLRKEFLNIMFITATVFTITGAVIAFKYAFWPSPSDDEYEGRALAAEEDVLPQVSKRIYCFFNESSKRRKPPMAFEVERINVALCDDLVYVSVAIVEQTNGVAARDTNFAIGEEGMRRFTKLKERDYSLISWILIGGEDTDAADLQVISRSRKRRAELTFNVGKWMQLYSFDGSVLYWKYPEPGEAAYVSALLLAFRRRANSENYRFAVVLPWSSNFRRNCFSVPDVLSSADVVFVDSHYTAAATNFPVTTFHTPLRTKSKAKRLGQAGLGNIIGDIAKEVHKTDKFVLSITLSGISFTLKNASNAGVGELVKGPGRLAPYSRRLGLVSQYEILHTLATDLNWVKNFDRIGQCPYIVNNDQWIGFEDEISIQSKSHLLLFTGGMAIWDITMDDFRGDFGTAFPILSKAREILLQNYSHNLAFRSSNSA